MNRFKIDTSAGGARPKIVVSENNQTCKIVAGDSLVSEDYNHSIINLSIYESIGYSQEKVEYGYYHLTQEAGIEMMPFKLIDDKHFATLRFDRQY